MTQIPSDIETRLSAPLVKKSIYANWKPAHTDF